MESSGGNLGGVLKAGLLPQFLLLNFAVWLHAANSMLAATTLPGAVSEFGGANLISWAFTLYQLGSITAAAGTGLLSRRMGLRTGLLLSASVYGVGTLFCAIAPTMEAVLLGRLLQGAGGGSLLALTYVAFSRIFPEHLIPRLVAFVSIVWSTSAFCGPLIGGTFATYGLWRMAFWAFVIQAAVFIVCVSVVFSEEEGEPQPVSGRFPVWRLAVLTLGVIFVSLAGLYVDPVLSPMLCVLGLAMVLAFLRMDRARETGYLFPREAMAVLQPMGAGLLMVFAASAATMSFLVYGPILLERLYGVTPLAAGFIVALESISWGIAAVVFSRVDVASDRRLIRLGTTVVVLGVVGFAVAMPAGNLWLVVACAMAQGAGFGTMWGFVIRRLVSLAKDDEKDVTSSAIPASQQIGFALGASAAGIVANVAGFADEVPVEAAQLAAFWVFAAFIPLAMLAWLVMWRFTLPPTSLAEGRGDSAAP